MLVCMYTYVHAFECVHISASVCVYLCVCTAKASVFAPTILCPAKSPKHSGVGVCVLLRASPGKARVGVGPSSARQKYG